MADDMTKFFSSIELFLKEKKTQNSSSMSDRSMLAIVIS